MIRKSIKQELESRSWTVKKLSDETGIRYPTLTEFLNGNKGLSIELLEGVCDKLDLELRGEGENLSISVSGLFCQMCGKPIRTASGVIQELCECPSLTVE